LRGSLSFIGFLFAICAAALFYAAHKDGLNSQKNTENVVRQLLSSQNASVTAQVEAQVQRGVRDAAIALSRFSSKKKIKARVYAQDISLGEPNAPQWIWSQNRRLKAAGAVDLPELEAQLEEFAVSSNALQVKTVNSKVFLFIQGMHNGEKIAAIYEPSALFSDFSAVGGMGAWVVNFDGYVAFHSQPRFLGSNAANLRPVASGLQSIAEGRRNSFAEKYLSLDGKNTFGAWTVIPQLGLLVGTEWAKYSPQNSSAFYFIAAALAAVIAAFFFGFSFRSKTEIPKEREENIFEASGRLDQDTLDYLAAAKGSAEQAIEYAKEQEKIAIESARQRGVLAGQFRFLEWKLAILESFQDQILSQSTGKQVWAALGALIAERTPGLVVIVYRYAASTFSLVPESFATALDLEKNAEAYLMDARIFIGKPQLIHSLQQTEAFDRWNVARVRHMQLHDMEFRSFPLEHGGAPKGLILMAYDARMNQGGELEEAFLLHAALIRRASSFCDSLGRLLQLSHAKGTAGATLASASNDARGQPRPS
jgi:hypothetical protein